MKTVADRSLPSPPPPPPPPPPGVLSLQVKKAYGKDIGGMEAHEEMARMREHAMSEVSVPLFISVDTIPLYS